jgi:hypothetical protein
MSALAADQILLHEKAKTKLSQFAEAGCWLTKKSFEQCSSEATAAYKSRLFSGKKMLDLSAGLGIDDIAFSSSFQQIVALDTDKLLNVLVRRNHQILNIQNITRLDTDAETYLSKCTEGYDLIYADADRRNQQGRSYGLSDASPDILRLLPLIFRHTGQLLLKLSPMFDIQESIRLLKGVSEIYVVERKGEVKELLTRVTPIENDNPIIHAVSCDEKGQVIRQYRNNAGSVNTPSQVHTYKGFLYEPSAALIKSGLTAKYLADLGMSMADSSSYLAISELLHADFFGRKFRIKEMFEFNKRLFKAFIEEENIHQANITIRNFPDSVDSFRKKWKLNDGGDKYLFLTTMGGKKWCIYAQGL